MTLLSALMKLDLSYVKISLVVTIGVTSKVS